MLCMHAAAGGRLGLVLGSDRMPHVLAAPRAEFWPVRGCLPRLWEALGTQGLIIVIPTVCRTIPRVVARKIALFLVHHFRAYTREWGNLANRSTECQNDVKL